MATQVTAVIVQVKGPNDVDELSKKPQQPPAQSLGLSGTHLQCEGSP